MRRLSTGYHLRCLLKVVTRTYKFIKRLIIYFRFTPDDYIKCLIEYQPETLFVVPSLLAFLATHPSVKKEHLQSVTTIMVGAAPTTDSMLEKFLLKCEKTKDDIKLLQGMCDTVGFIESFNLKH